jgi:hypothetical protein
LGDEAGDEEHFTGALAEEAAEDQQDLGHSPGTPAGKVFVRAGF